MGVIWLVVFGAGSVAACLAGSYWAGACFAVLAVCGICLAASAGRYEITSLRVIHRTVYGHFEIAWRDVQSVEIGAQGALVLNGANKRFVIAPMAALSGADKDKAARLLVGIIETLEVPVTRNARADFRLHRNART